MTQIAVNAKFKNLKIDGLRYSASLICFFQKILKEGGIHLKGHYKFYRKGHLSYLKTSKARRAKALLRTREFTNREIPSDRNQKEESLIQLI